MHSELWTIRPVTAPIFPGEVEFVLNICVNVHTFRGLSWNSCEIHYEITNRWSEAAQAFLVSEAQDLAERQALATAMAESLQEEEKRKASQKPLKQWSSAELAARFCSSSILALVRLGPKLAQF